MKIHRLFQEQTLNLGIDEAWAFFSRPQNLDEITPPDMKFRITSKSIPEMFEGQIITYRIQLAPFLWQTWVTEIKAVAAGRSFIDEQRFGPYKFWHHRHELVPVTETETKVTDEIHYALGFGPFGDLAHCCYVGNKLKSIFEFRRHALDEKFNRPETAAAPSRESMTRNSLPGTPALQAGP